MAWTLCTSGSAILKAGKNASSVITASGSALLEFSDNAEGRICAECHTDFISNYSSLDPQIKYALADVCSNLIAMDIVSYDMSGYSDRREAETILDKLDDRVNKGLIILKQKQFQNLN